MVETYSEDRDSIGEGHLLVRVCIFAALGRLSFGNEGKLMF